MCSWAGLFSEDEKKLLIEGVNAMLKIAINYCQSHKMLL
jgi:hypothetical protein